MPIRITPPPAMSCLMPWLLAPGLSFPYPSRRLMTPHTPKPAPMAVTRVWRIVILLLKKPIKHVTGAKPCSFMVLLTTVFHKRKHRKLCPVPHVLALFILSSLFLSFGCSLISYQWWDFLPSVGEARIGGNICRFIPLSPPLRPPPSHHRPSHTDQKVPSGSFSVRILNSSPRQTYCVCRSRKAPCSACAL